MLGVLSAIVPMITRKSYLFGVLVPEEIQETELAKKMKKHYVMVCLMGAMVLMLLTCLQYIAIPRLSLMFTMYLPFVFIIIQLAVYIPSWKKVLALKKERGWQVESKIFTETNTTYTKGSLSQIPWAYFVIGLGLILVSTGIALIQYPSLPNQLPTHFNMQMEPNAWATKTVLTVLSIPLTNVLLWAVMLLSCIMVVKAKLQIDPQNPALSYAQHKQYRKLMGHGLGAHCVILNLVFMLLGFQMIWSDFRMHMGVILLIILVPVLIFSVIVVRAGQGGRNLKPKHIKPLDSDTEQLTQASTNNNDEYWALGMFYHNAKDPSYIVEDRFGANMGFNYGHLLVKIGVIVFGLAFVIAYICLTVLLWSAL
jgi:uncharacterized membrane protein